MAIQIFRLIMHIWWDVNAWRIKEALWLWRTYIQTIAMFTEFLISRHAIIRIPLCSLLYLPKDKYVIFQEKFDLSNISRLLIAILSQHFLTNLFYFFASDSSIFGLTIFLIKRH